MSKFLLDNNADDDHPDKDTWATTIPPTFSYETDKLDIKNNLYITNFGREYHREFSCCFVEINGQLFKSTETISG